MLNDLKSLPDDQVELKGLVTLLTSELKNRDLKITDLKHQLAGHNRRRFGTKSEGLDQLQLSLAEDEAIAVAAETAGIPEPEVGEPKNKPSAILCQSFWNAGNRFCHWAMIAVNAAEA